MATELTFKEGPGGWIGAELWDDGAVLSRCWVCLVREAEGWQPAALFLLSPTPEAVRAVPLNRIVVAANASADVTEKLAARIDDPVPALGSAEFLEAFSGYQRAARFVLERPPGHRLDSSFYEDVARAYREAAAHGLKPRTTIAEDAGVSSDTAGRWVYVARKRGFLPRTVPGKVSVSADASMRTAGTVTPGPGDPL